MRLSSSNWTWQRVEYRRPPHTSMKQVRFLLFWSPQLYAVIHSPCRRVKHKIHIFICARFHKKIYLMICETIAAIIDMCQLSVINTHIVIYEALCCDSWWSNLGEEKIMMSKGNHIRCYCRVDLWLSYRQQIKIIDL